MSIEFLFQSIKERRRPENVALAIRDLIGDRLTLRQKAVLDKAATYGCTSSYMPSQFRRAETTLDGQIKVVKILFPNVPAPKSDLPEPEELRAYLDLLTKDLHKTGNDFKADRLNHEGRLNDPALPKGHRAYNKRFRLLSRMEEKLVRWQNNVELCDLAQVAKSRLALYLPKAEFESDLDTACFVAYMTARLNVRSTFTWGKQERANDQIADMLLARLEDRPATNWLAVAHVHTDPSIIAKLTEEQRGRMLGLWFDLMKKCAVLLDKAAANNNLDLKRMIVKRGNDSSTWNSVAGAYNKARDGWISTLFALGAQSVLDAFAPTKALRLMAADVAYMHSAHGSGGLEPDTAVWGALPKPWDIVLGRKTCNRKTIEAACQKFGVEGKGWVSPRPKTVAEFKPTPELVHGVIVSSPELGAILRKANYFCGPSQSLKEVGVFVDKLPVGDVMVAFDLSPESTPPRSC